MNALVSTLTVTLDASEPNASDILARVYELLKELELDGYELDGNLVIRAHRAPQFAEMPG